MKKRNSRGLYLKMSLYNIRIIRHCNNIWRAAILVCNITLFGERGNRVVFWVSLLLLYYTPLIVLCYITRIYRTHDELFFYFSAGIQFFLIYRVAYIFLGNQIYIITRKKWMKIKFLYKMKFQNSIFYNCSNF
jgi:hypothetical protein